MDLISVIVPAYNVEQYIARCLDSITGQSYTNIEVIVVDDGSSDATAQICDDKALKDDRIIVVHKKNEGVAAARNTALDAVKGELVAFCDADDYYEPDMLARLYETMTEYKADMICCGYYEEFSDHTVKRGAGLGTVEYNRHEAFEDYFKMGGRIGSGCWNKLIRRSSLEGVRYKKYTMGEDVEMLSRTIGNCNRVVCLDYTGYHYVHRDDSATQLVFRKENMDIIRVMEEMSSDIKDNYPELIKQFYGFHASWYVATLQVMKRSGKMSAYKEEQAVLKSDIRSNMRFYRGNPYVYKVDMILLRCFLINCFVPVQTAYELISALRHSK